MPAADATRWRDALPPLDASGEARNMDTLHGYLERYGLQPGSHEHRFGSFRSGAHVVAAHLYTPTEPRGTVLVMHGFLDHSGTLAPTIRHLLDRGFAVAAYDEPGHGLSSGPRASIGDFGDYGAVLRDFLSLWLVKMPPPYHVVAHSTGAAILVDHLLSDSGDPFEAVVLVAPLVRSAYWYVSRAMSPVMDVFVDQVPRVFRDNSSDAGFLESVRRDPLQPRVTSLNWFNALVDWNERVARLAADERPVLILQGDADSVVDWDFNLAFLTRKFPNARVAMIEGGRHQLLNEAEPLKAEVLALIDRALQD